MAVKKFSREQEAKMSKIARVIKPYSWSENDYKNSLFEIINTLKYDEKLLLEVLRREGINKPENINPAQIFGRKGQAEEFIKKQPVYYDKAGLWWLWSKSRECWECTDEVDVLNGIEKELNVGVVKSQERTEILNSLKQGGRKHKPVEADPKIIQFKNGLVHLDEPTALIVPNSHYFITNPLPYNIGKTGKTPIMDKIFEDWVGKKYVRTLYELIACGLHRDYQLKRIFLFPGIGNNGKRCFFNLIIKRL